MNRSEQINEIAAALCKAQGELLALEKSKTVNVGSYSYSYATLAATYEAIRGALLANDLAVTQTFDAIESGNMILTTTLMHSSGQWLSSSMPCIFYEDPQDTGKGITYHRRYALQAIVGVAPEDKHEKPDRGDSDGKIDKSAKRWQKDEKQQTAMRGELDAATVQWSADHRNTYAIAIETAVDVGVLRQIGRDVAQKKADGNVTQEDYDQLVALGQARRALLDAEGPTYPVDDPSKGPTGDALGAALRGSVATAVAEADLAPEALVADLEDAGETLPWADAERAAKKVGKRLEVLNRWKQKPAAVNHRAEARAGDPLVLPLVTLPESDEYSYAVARLSPESPL